MKIRLCVKFYLKMYLVWILFAVAVVVLFAYQYTAIYL